jgi:ABC-type antimicrobial peptide transport system permease subunit
VAVGLSGSLGLAIAASLVVAAIGLVLTAVVGARERRPAFAVLRALGTRAGELRRWLLLETLPLVGVSAGAGAFAGIALARLGLPSLAVSAEGQRAVPSPLLVIPWSTLAVIVTIAAAAGMALPIATARLLRRHRTADELRIGDTS